MKNTIAINAIAPIVSKKLTIPLCSSIHFFRGDSGSIGDLGIIFSIL